MADNFNFVQVQKFQLAGSGATSTATSIILESFKLNDASTTITLANFGDIGFATMEPGTSREEQISFTGVTQNADGTATLTGATRGLRFVAPYDEVSANKKAHAGGTIFVISNTAAFYNELTGKDNDETVTGIWTFTSTSIPRLSAAGTYGAGTEEYFATKRYVDSVAIAGASDASTTAKGIVEEATQAEVDAGTAAGGTAARLFINPSTHRARAYNDYAADAVGTDAYAITITPAITAYATGQVFTFKAGTANTGAATLAVSGLSAIAIKKSQGLDIETGDIKANQITMVVYDGTNMQLLSGLAKAKISQDGSEIYAADSVGTDTYAVTLTPTPAAYVTGMKIRFKAGTANTGVATLNVNALGAKTIVKNYNVTLGDSDIKAGQMVEVIYDVTGDNFQMVSQIANQAYKTTVIPANQFNGLTNFSQVAVDTTIVIPSVSGTDGLNSYFGLAAVVPKGCTGIASARVIYKRDSTGNLLLAFRTSHINMDGLPSALETDTTDTQTTYGGGSAAGDVGSITIPAGAYNGLTSIAEGDVIGMSVQREANQASDTYNVAWVVYAVEIVFS